MAEQIAPITKIWETAIDPNNPTDLERISAADLNDIIKKTINDLVGVVNIHSAFSAGQIAITAALTTQPLTATPSILTLGNAIGFQEGTDVTADGTNFQRLTANTTGYYRMYINIAVEFSTSDTIIIFLYKNGAASGAGHGAELSGRGPGRPVLAAYITPMQLTAGDYIEIWAAESGGDTSVVITGGVCTLEFIKAS